METTKELLGRGTGMTPLIASDPDLDDAQNVAQLEQLGRVLQLGLELQQREVEEAEDGLDALAKELEDVERENEGLKLALDAAEAQTARTPVGTPGARAGEARRIELLERQLEEESERCRVLDRENRALESEMLEVKAQAESAENARQAAVSEGQELRGRVQALEDEAKDLRASLAAEQKKAALRGEDERGMAGRLAQRTRDLDRVYLENEELAKQNEALSLRAEGLQAEVLQLSEALVQLDDHQRVKDVKEGDLHVRLEGQAREREALQQTVEELEAALSSKGAAVEALEHKMREQRAQWQAEVESLSSQLQGSAAAGPAAQSAARFAEQATALLRDGSGSSGSEAYEEAFADADQPAMRAALRDAHGKVRLLLEAYEQLEKDTGREVDFALERQKARMQSLEAESQARERTLKVERERYTQLDQTLGETQAALEDALQRNRKYESGVYGLPEAIQEIKKLRGSGKESSLKLEAHVARLNGLSERLEDVLEENRFLRRKAGVSEEESLEVSDLRLQSQVTIAQLRGLNAQLQRELVDVEEEKRRLRMELRFHSRAQGKGALTMGLTPNQMLLLDEYAESLRYGGGLAGEESRVVKELEKQLHVLQDRLAEAHAAGNLGEAVGQIALDTSAGSSYQASASAAQHQSLQDAASLLRQRNAALVTQLQGLQECVGRAREELQARIEATDDTNEHARALRQVRDILENAQSAETLLLAGSGGPRAADTGGVVTDENMKAELKRLSALVAAREADLLRKDVELQEALKCVATQSPLPAGRPASAGPVPGNTTGTAAAASSPVRYGTAASAGAATPPTGLAESSSLARQLMECLEDLDRRDKLLQKVQPELKRYRDKLQALTDSRSLLYAEFFRRQSKWEAERKDLERRAVRAEADAADSRTEAVELERLVAALEPQEDGKDPSSAALKLKLREAFVRLAALQVRHAKSARDAGEARAAAAAAAREKAEAQRAAASATGLLRARVQHLEAAYTQAHVRCADLSTELGTSCPTALLVEARAVAAKLAEQARKKAAAAAETDFPEGGAAEEAAQAAAARKGRDKAENDARKARAALEQEQATRLELEKLLAAARGAAPGTFPSPHELDDLRADTAQVRAEAASATRRAELAEADLSRAREEARDLRGRIAALDAAAEKTARAAASAMLAHTAGIPAAAASQVAGHEGGESGEARAEAALREVEAARDAAEARASEALALAESLRATQAAAERGAERAREALRGLQGTNSEAAQACERFAEEVSAARAEARAAVAARTEADNRASEAAREAARERKRARAGTAAAHRARSEARSAQSAALRAAADAAAACVPASDEVNAWERGWAKAAHEAASEAEGCRAAARSARAAANAERARAEALETELAGARSAIAAVELPEEDSRARLARACEERAGVDAECRRLRRELETAEEAAVDAERRAAARERRAAEAERTAFAEVATARALAAQAHADSAHLVRNTQDSPGLGASSPEPSTIEGSLSGDSTLLLGANQVTPAKDGRSGEGFGGQSHVAALEDLAAGARLKADLGAERARRLQAEGARVLAEERAKAAEAEAAVLLARLQAHLRGLEVSGAAVSGGSEAEAEAVRHVQEAVKGTVARLQEAVREREAEAEDLRQALREARREGAEGRKHADAEIQRLAAALSQLKGGHAALDPSHATPMSSSKASASKSTVSKGLGVGGASDKQLLARLQAKEAELEVAHSQASQAEARAAVVEERLNEALMQREADLREAREEAERERARGPSGVLENLVARLRSQLANKDMRLEQLRGAIKTLEERLVAAMMQGADGAMAAAEGFGSSGQQQRLAESVQKWRDSEAKLAKAREECSRSKSRAKDVAGKLSAALKDLERERERSSKLASELAREQRRMRTIGSSREKKASSGRVASGVRPASAPGGATTPRGEEGSATTALLGVVARAELGKVDQLERRIKVLEAQNSRLKAQLRAEDPGADVDEEAESAKGRPEGSATQNPQSQPRSAAKAAAPEPARSMLASNPALAQWEEGKKLKRQLELAKKKAARASEKLAGAEKDAEKYRKLAAQVEAQNQRLTVRLRDLEGKLKAAREARKAAGEVPSRTFLDQLKLAEERAAEQELRAAKLQAKLADRAPLAAEAAGDDTESLEDQLFEMRLERDQANAQVQRLQGRLEAVALSQPGVGAGTSAERGVQGPVRGRAEGMANARRVEELEAVVDGLQRALERTKREGEQNVSSQKYMASVQKVRDMKRELESAQTELKKASRAASGVKDMEAKVAALEKESASLKRRLREKDQKEGQLQGGVSQRETELEQRLTESRKEAGAKDAEITELLALVAARATPEQLETLQTRVSDLEGENADMRSELSAFDPDFFEEIEQLKYEHHQLTQRCDEQQRTIALLTREASGGL